MGPELMEMRRLQKALPSRPSFSELEWALSTIGQVNHALSFQLQELSRIPRPMGVPASVFEALQEMRKEAMEEEAAQQRRQAEAVSRLEQRHRLYDAWIQLAYDALSSSFALSSNSSPPAPVAIARRSVVYPSPPPPLPPPPPAPEPSCVAGAAASAAKSASDVKRDPFPSESSTTSATQVSSAAALDADAPPSSEGHLAETPTTKLADGLCGKEDLPSEFSPVRKDIKITPTFDCRTLPCPQLISIVNDGVTKRGCNWLEHETFSLIDGKRKLAKEMRAYPTSVLLKSKQQRWEFVAGYLEKLGIYKTWQQCVYRWNRLWKPFKTIYGYETRNAPSNGSSYWRLCPDERLVKRLPRNYSVKVYDILKQYFVEEKMGIPSSAPNAAVSVFSLVCKEEEDVDEPPKSEEERVADDMEETKVEVIEEDASSPDDMSSAKKQKHSEQTIDKMPGIPAVQESSCMACPAPS